MDVIKYVYKKNEEIFSIIKNFGVWYILAYGAFAYMSLQLNPLLWCDPARVAFAACIVIPVIIQKGFNEN